MQVDKKMFDVTKKMFSNILLSEYSLAIQNNFGINWLRVEWRDLRKPLYSALGARLFIMYRSRLLQDDIPRSIEDQSEFWHAHYRPDSDVQLFNTRATEFENRESNFMISSLEQVSVHLTAKLDECVKLNKMATATSITSHYKMISI